MLRPVDQSGLGFWRSLFTPALWELVKPITVYIGDTAIVIPAGQRTDGMSVPRFLKPFFPERVLYSVGAYAHDYLYQHGECSKWMADACLFEIMRRVSRFWWPTCAAVWFGLWFGGWPTWWGYRRHDPKA